MSSAVHLAALIPLLLYTIPSAAQQPNTLLHAIPSPPTGVQSGGNLGYSVAVDGGYTVVGALYDDVRTLNSGVVKVFDSDTGALLHVIANPNPSVNAAFGISVAISGTRVAVGTGQSAGAYVFDLSSATPTLPVASLTSPTSVGGDYFGIAVAISGARVVVGAIHEDTGADSAGSAYVYDLSSGTPTVPVATLNNPTPEASDFFGYSVAISGTRVVVGTQFDDTGTSNSGSAYVYDLTSATPTVPLVTLNNPSPAVSDEFGGSVAISGNRVVIGARNDDTGALNAGSVYVYDLSSGTPAVPTVVLTNPTPQALAYLGRSVAISGTLVVAGAYGASSLERAYIYDLSGTMPALPVATLNNPGPGASGTFGYAVAISATRVVVGAYGDDMGAEDAGSAYVYDLSNGTPTVPVVTLNHPGPSSKDYFGSSVAISGTRVVVGVPNDDTGAVDAGIVYVYDLASATPTLPVATLNNPSPSSGANFGSSVAISGTLVVVGAYLDTFYVPNPPLGSLIRFRAGRALVFDLAGATPTVPVVTLNNPDPAQNDLFGYSVAISGMRVVVGAYQDDTGAINAGSAYVYDLSSATPTLPLATLNNPNPAADDRFGYSVAISGTRVVVGASLDDTGAINAGSAYVYDLSSAMPAVPVQTLNNPTPAAYDYFGASVAVSDTRVVVGAYGDSTAAYFAGSAYIYDLSSATPPVPVQTLNRPGSPTSAFFGYSVAISGTRVAVGASNDGIVASSAGSSYVYDLANVAPTMPVATLNKLSPAMGDGFGSAVAIDGTMVVIGTPNDDTMMADKGAAYIFGPHPLDEDSDGLLDSWEQLHWPGAAGSHGPLDDDDHDGLVNLLELAFGLNPTVPDAGALTPLTQEGGYLTMTLTKRPGAAYEVQSAGTLTPGQPDSFSAATTTVLLDDATTLKVRDNTLTSTATARFMRVQVTGAP